MDHTTQELTNVKKYLMNLNQELKEYEAIEKQRPFTDEEQCHVLQLQDLFIQAAEIIQANSDITNAQLHYIHLKEEERSFRKLEESRTLSDKEREYLNGIREEIYKLIRFIAEKREFGEAQYQFVKGFRRLNYYKLIQSVRRLTKKEEWEIDAIKTSFWESIVAYVSSEYKAITSKYITYNDSRADVLQSVAAKVFEIYEKYDPYRSTPTTFFVTRIREEITAYIRSYSQNLTQYDAKNVSLVRSAVAYYESIGADCDEYMISNRTGLSLKIVKSTLYYASNSRRATIDDAYTVRSNTPTPEEECLRSEHQEIINRAIRQVLDDEEIAIFYTKVNPEDSKPLPYSTVAKMLHMTQHEVKQKYNTIIAKLNNSSELIYLNYLSTGKKPVPKETLHFQDDAVDIMEDQLLSVIEE